MNLLTVDPAIAAGLVKVSIVRDPTHGGGPGCTTLGGVDLSAASQSEIPELRVQNDAATLSNITFQKLSGPFAVGGSIVNPVTISTTFAGDLSCASLGDFTATTGGGLPTITVAGGYAGNMTINGTNNSLGGLTLGGLSGSVTCNPNVSSGGVTINGDISGTLDLVGASSSSTGDLTVNGNITSTGNVIARKSVSDRVHVGGDIAGTLDLRADVTGTTHELSCGGNVAGTLLVTGSTVYAAIEVNGDVTGLIHVTGPLHADVPATYGHVRVLGSLGASGTPGEIWLQNGMSSDGDTPKAYVCFNYDGAGRHGSVLDQWYSGSTVVVGANTYTAPNDAARVHAAPPSCGLGDCNGDGNVDFADIDPFVALLNVVPADYPGRIPSLLFMGDCDCSGSTDFADIDSFTGLLFEDCGTCPHPASLTLGGENLQMQSEGNTGGDADPLYVATYLGQNTSAANHDLLLDSIAALANNPPESAHVAWDEVLAILTGQ